MPVYTEKLYTQRPFHFVYKVSKDQSDKASVAHHAYHENRKQK